MFLSNDEFFILKLEKRKSMKKKYNVELEVNFPDLVERAASNLPNIKILSVDGYCVHFEVTSNSGKSKYEATLDNTHSNGMFTKAGTYWCGMPGAGAPISLHNEILKEVQEYGNIYFDEEDWYTS